MGQSSLDSLKTTSSTMNMFVVLALAAAAVAEPEAAADAQYISTYGAYGAYPYAHASPLASYVATPAVRTVAAPLTTYSHVASPFVKAVAAPAVRTVVVPAVASHTVTSYNSPNHYTAVSNGAFGPSYIAKNGAVQHVVKREAEAEADPALIYNTPLASTYAYNQVAPLTTTYSHGGFVSSPYVAAPAVRTVSAPLTTYAASYAASPFVNSYKYNGLYNGHYIGKREAEAEADPSLFYRAAPLTAAYNHLASPLAGYVAAPVTTYNYIVASPLSYTHVATPLASNGAHAVAATTMGWIHSANVGVCTNVKGQQVAC